LDFDGFEELNDDEYTILKLRDFNEMNVILFCDWYRSTTVWLKPVLKILVERPKEFDVNGWLIKNINLLWWTHSLVIFPQEKIIIFTICLTIK
jgi:hypothetical protein